MTDRTSEGATEPVAASDAPPPAGVEPSHGEGAVVVRAQTELVLPEECACCGAPPVRRVREVHFSGRVAFVPYCAECHAHVSREGTRMFAMSLSSAIIAFTFAAGLPLLWQPRAAALYALSVLLSGLLPFGLGALWPRKRTPGHASIGRAAIFRVDGSLSCARSEWGRAVARKSETESHDIPFRERVVPRTAVAVLVAVCAALPVYYRVHFPSVRVVNLTDGRLEIIVDGRSRGAIPPTSAESTGAGVELRVAAGQRMLSAKDGNGSVVDTETVSVRSGGQHLYAPASDAYCFWVETTGYGRSKGTGTEIQPLRGPGRFWALEDTIDLWFSPLPDADFDDRSTGGYLRAVRQARCDAAPGSARGAGQNGEPPPFATGVQ